MGHTVTCMCLQVALSYLMDRQFTRTEAINNLMALTHAMVSIYLTEKGKIELGDMSVPHLADDEVSAKS